MAEGNIHSQKRRSLPLDFFKDLDTLAILKFLGLALALFFPVCFMIAMLGYFLGVNFISIAFISAGFVSFFFLYIMKLKKKMAIIIALLLVSTFVGGGLIASEFYAYGFDSTYFHELVIISLKNGWNPAEYHVGIKIPEIEILNIPDNLETKLYTSEYTRSYAKSLHIVFAAFFSAVGNLEAAKGLSFVGMVMVFSLCTVFYSKTFSNLSLIESGIWGLVTAACPVAITASSTFYLDGILYLSLVTIIAIFSLYIVEKNIYLLYIGLFFSIFFINIKHSAVLFFVVTIIIFVLLFLYYKTDSIVRLFKVFGIFTLLALIFSFHPYIQNFQKYGEPTGVGNMYDNFSDTPPDFMHLGQSEKFVRSVFSVATHNAQQITTIRFPFLFSKNELFDYSYEPAKIGGWGPLYSGILILSFIFFLFFIFYSIYLKSYEQFTFIYLAIIATIIITIEIFSLSWYSRYMPQAWLLPIFFALPYLTKKNNLLKCIRFVILTLLVLNIILVAYAHYSWQFNYTKKYNLSLEEVRKNGNEVYIANDRDQPLGFIFLYSYLYKLIQQNTTIHFINDNEINANYAKISDENFFVYIKTNAIYYYLEYRMVQDGVGWFGQSILVPLAMTSNQPDNAKIVTHSFPDTIVAGQNYSVTVTVMNTGTNTWTPGANYSLGAVDDWSGSEETFWIIKTPIATPVAPGQTYNFSFVFSAPTNATNNDLKCQMVQSGAGGFGQSLSVPMAMTPNQTNNARIVTTSFPDTIIAGQNYSVMVTILNTGTNTWTPVENYNLGAIGDWSGDAAKFGIVRVPIASSVAPGQTNNFSFTITSPKGVNKF